MAEIVRKPLIKSGVDPGIEFIECGTSNTRPGVSVSDTLVSARILKPGSSVECLMNVDLSKAYEDFNDWIVYDPHDVLSIVDGGRALQLEINGLATDDDPIYPNYYAYKDFGSNYFNGRFRMEFDLYHEIAGVSPSGNIIYKPNWYFNNVGTPSFGTADEYFFWEDTWDASSESYGIDVFTPDGFGEGYYLEYTDPATYYFRVDYLPDDDCGANGAFIVYIFTDANRETLFSWDGIVSDCEGVPNTEIKGFLSSNNWQYLWLLVRDTYLVQGNLYGLWKLSNLRIWRY